MDIDKMTPDLLNIGAIVYITALDTSTFGLVVMRRDAKLVPQHSNH